MRPILIDLDDTLLDDRTSSHLAFKALIEVHRQNLLGKSFDSLWNIWKDIAMRNWERHERGELSFLDQRRERVREFLKLELSDPEADQAFSPFLKVYQETWSLLPGALEFLERTVTIPKVIVTNGERVQQIQKLEATNILGHFAAVITPKDCGVPKPHDDIFIHSATLLGAKPSSCIMIGDDEHRDIIPAKRLGMLSFHMKPESSAAIFAEILSLMD